MMSCTGRRARRTVNGLVAVSTVAGSLCLAAAAFAASTQQSPAAPRYHDGLWSVSIVTEKGDCDRGYRYPIRITNGVLSNPGDQVFTIVGKVTPAGAIVVTVSAGNKSATGTGRLAGDIGGGSWSGGACSGSWTAERRGA
jgi:hypothetical protein